MQSKPADVLQRIRELREEYAALHRLGMAALENHDLATLTQAIMRESQIIEEQRLLLQHLKPRSAS